jgi:hypothetical protein
MNVVELEHNIKRFLARRRNAASRKRAATVLAFLSGGKWVRWRDLKKQVGGSDLSLSRLLKDLEKERLIQKKEGRFRNSTKKITHYRAPGLYPAVWLMPREDLEVDCVKAWQTVGQLHIEQNLLISLLQEKGVKDPLAVVRKRIEDGKEAHLESIREDLRKRGVSEERIKENIKKIAG